MDEEVKTLRGALAAIAYMDLSHLSRDEERATLRNWALMALRGEHGKYEVIDLTQTFKNSEEYQSWRAIRRAAAKRLFQNHEDHG